MCSLLFAWSLTLGIGYSFIGYNGENENEFTARNKQWRGYIEVKKPICKGDLILGIDQIDTLYKHNSALTDGINSEDMDTDAIAMQVTWEFGK